MPVRVIDRHTGKVVEVKSAEVMQGLGSKYDVADDRVRVIRGDQVGTVPKAELQQALGAGFKLVDDEEAAEHKRVIEANTAGSNAQAAAESVASGLTLGLSDLALTESGIVDPEAMRMRHEAMGALSPVLRAGGEVAGALLSGGGTLAAKGSVGAARLLPSVMLERAGMSAGARLGEGMAGVGVRSAIEGFGYGVGQEIHESVLGETDLNAERLLAGGLTAAAIGGAAGSAIPGLHKIAQRGGQRLVGATRDVLGAATETFGPASRELSEAVARGDDSLVEKWLRMQPGADPAVAARVARAARETPGGLNEAITKGAKLDEDLTRLLRDDLGSLNRLMDDTRMAAEGAAKYRGVAAAIPKEVEHIARAESINVVRGLRNELDDMAQENAMKWGKKFDTNRLDEARAYIGKAEAEMGLAENYSAAKHFEIVDRLKRDLQKEIDWNIVRGKRRADVPSEVETINKRLATMQGRLKEHLVRDDLFGKAAARQVAINSAWEDYFAAVGAFKGENGRGLLGRVFDEGGTVNLRTARQIARQYGKNGAEAGDHLQDVLEARQRLLRAYKEHTELPPDVLKRIDESEAGVKRMQSEMRKRADAAALADDMEHFRNIEGNRSVSIGALSTMGPAVGGVLGGVLGGLPGAVVGAVIGNVTRPYTVLRTYAGIKSWLDGVAGGIDVPIGKVFKKLGLAGVAVAKEAGRASGEAGRKASALTAAHLTADERQERIEKVREVAPMLASSPDALARALELPLYDLRQVAPNLDSAVSRKMHTAAAYLAQNAPVPYEAPFGEKLYDPVQERDYEDQIEAVIDPISVIEKIPKGTCSVKHVDALKVVYPEIYTGIQERLLDALVTAQAKKKPIPLDMRSQLGILFDVQTDVGLTPGMVTELARIHAQPEQPPPGSQPAPQKPRQVRATTMKGLVSNTLTPAQRLAGGGS